ncbi:hypothetical protein OFDDKENP_00246 [Aeromonas phage B614]|nr:hypothetical protein OFDDKENP_00246 [Aeromonas phage B614]UYD58277.1 hypothetical protein JNEOFJEA_00198 [Aeromonas phage UP87]UYD58391.1 hypothetical protein IPAKJDPM_00048 [Aeromonas phage avDM14-QBC]UYD58607.1 hypothetical protein HNNIDBEH_00014 [Aeromonas phage avDM10-HWA]UYD59090.1 hypothetical protein OFOPOMKI_00240 [Aeromonas phage avDM7-IJDJ]UYD59902.1 hypothetical protein LEHPIFIF_00129 [Aeromonas phage avDM9-HANS]
MQLPHGTELCPACKMPVEKVLAVQTQYGPAHPGPCAHHLESIPLSESSSSIVEETELLM